MDWLDWVSRVGIPAAAMGAMALAIWRVAVWVAPRIDGMIEAHRVFLGQLIATQEKLRESIDRHDAESQETYKTIVQQLIEIRAKHT